MNSKGEKKLEFQRKLEHGSVAAMEHEDMKLTGNEVCIIVIMSIGGKTIRFFSKD